MRVCGVGEGMSLFYIHIDPYLLKPASIKGFRG